MNTIRYEMYFEDFSFKTSPILSQSYAINFHLASVHKIVYLRPHISSNQRLNNGEFEKIGVRSILFLCLCVYRKIYNMKEGLQYYIYNIMYFFYIRIMYILMRPLRFPYNFDNWYLHKYNKQIFRNFINI